MLQAAHSALMSVLPLLMWTAASSGLIVVNKIIMVDLGFGYPLFLTATGQLASAVGGYMMAALGVTKSNRSGPLPIRFLLTSCLPVAACTALTLFLGNYAYLSLSMAFIQILKAFTPACTYLVGVAVGIEPLASTLLAAVAGIAAGTCVSTWAEVTGGGAGHFSWLGFSSFMASVLTEAIRVLALQHLLSRQRCSTSDVNVYVSLPTAALLLAASFLWEGEGLKAHGLGVLRDNAPLYCAAMAGSFLLNAVTYWAIQACGGLTLKVAGCVKNVLVVGVGLLQGELVAAPEVAGYAISMAGFAVYSAAQQATRRATAAASEKTGIKAE